MLASHQTDGRWDGWHLNVGINPFSLALDIVFIPLMALFRGFLFPAKSADTFPQISCYVFEMRSVRSSITISRLGLYPKQSNIRTEYCCNYNDCNDKPGANYSLASLHFGL
uniref:Uncharacterized protein n=1 Tax=Anopheles maculatus TaxID=74869 RepID=A0A182SS59_9DIPT